MAGALFLVRHGQTPLNRSDNERLRGWLDVPLAAPGIHAARRAARALVPFGPTVLYTSDLTRALDTARIMSVTLARTPQPLRDLRPWNVGDYAGQPVSLAGPILTVYMNGKADIAPPGGESFNAFYERWRERLRALLNEVRYEDTNIVAVTHARNLYALHRILYGDEIPVQGPPHPGAVIAVGGTPLDTRTLVAGTADGGAS